MAKQNERFETFRDRAEAFMEGAKVFDNDQEFHLPQALLCVHAAVSYADAVAVFLEGQHFSPESHGEAVGKLKKVCANSNRNTDGLEHLADLIGAKSSVAYGGKVLRPEQSARLRISIGRFAVWVYRTFPELAARSDVS